MSSFLNSVKGGDEIGAAQHNLILRLLKRRVTGPMVTESAEGWHIRRDPGKKTVIMGRITASTGTGSDGPFVYAWEQVTVIGNQVAPLVGGQSGTVVNDFAFNTSEFLVPPTEPVLTGMVVQLSEETNVGGVKFRLFTVTIGVNERGPSTNASKVVKLAQVVGERLRCFEFVTTSTDVPIASGVNGFVVGTFDVFQDTVAGTFIDDEVQPGMFVNILDGPHAGLHEIWSVQSQTALRTNTVFDSGQNDIEYEIPGSTIIEAIPDYSTVLEANSEPGSPEHRYLAYSGPGDHFGVDASTQQGSTVVSSLSSNFQNSSNPVLPGMYISLFNGSDAGRYLITGIASPTVLILGTPMTETAPANLSFRIDIVSSHATSLQLVPIVGADFVAFPDQNRIEVKIARAIRNFNDAQLFDVSQEGGTRARDLFNEHGPFLLCHRLKSGANESQGVPVDKSVFILAFPWRGHDVDGVLFFDEKGGQKFDLTDDDEPVWIMGWYRDRWRVELAIGREPLPEPTEDEACPVE